MGERDLRPASETGVFRLPDTAQGLIPYLAGLVKFYPRLAQEVEVDLGLAQVALARDDVRDAKRLAAEAVKRVVERAARNMADYSLMLRHRTRQVPLSEDEQREVALLDAAFERQDWPSMFYFASRVVARRKDIERRLEESVPSSPGGRVQNPPVVPPPDEIELVADVLAPIENVSARSREDREPAQRGVGARTRRARGRGLKRRAGQEWDEGDDY